MRKILILFLFLISAYVHAQVQKGTGIFYFTGEPTLPVNVCYDGEVGIDTTTGLWWEYSRDFGFWILAGFRVQKFATCAAPTYTPVDKQSEIVLNGCDSLYRWRDGAWHHLNPFGGGTDTSGYNLNFYISNDSLYIVDGDGAFSVNLDPYLDNTDTSGYNLDFRISGDTLYIKDGAGQLFVLLSPYANVATNLTFSGSSSPVTLNSSTGTDVTITAGTGIGLAATSGNITITNTAPDQVVSITNGGGVVVTGTYPAFTLTAVDQSATNELQTLANTSDATTHTVTLSNSGGSFQLAEGSNITLTTTGTGLNGIVTISAAAAAATDLTFSGASSPVTLNSSTGADVTITAGTGISLSATSGNITVTNTGDLSATNELQTLANTSTATTHVATLSNSGGSVTLSEGSGITIATTGTTLDGIATITAVDPSLSNEGSLTVAAGTGTTSVINSNTSGSTGVTIEAGTGLSISEAGNVITLTNTGDLSNTNELQTLANTSGATTHTVTLSNSGGSVQLVEGANVTLTTTGTGLDGIVTIASTATATDGNGIYGDGTAGSGDDVLPTGGSTVTLPGQWQPLQFDANTAGGQVWTALKVNAATCTDDRFTKYIVGKSPSDSLEIYNFDCGGVIKETGGLFTLQTDREMYLVTDSFNMTTVTARTILPYVLGITPGGWVNKIEGTSNGQILKWNETSGYWEVGAAPSSGATGTGANGQVTYWTGTTTIAGENNYWWDAGNDRLGIGTNGSTPSSSLDVTKNSLGTTQTTTSGLALVNTTAAAAGAQQISPAMRWSGAGWKTNATAASQSVEFRSFVTPVQGTSDPSGYLGIGSAINGSWTDNQTAFSSGGEIGIGTQTFSGKLNVNAGSGGFPGNFYGASGAGSSNYVQIANTTTTGTEALAFNEVSTLTAIPAVIQRFGSTHATRAKELNIGTYESNAPVTITMNSTVRMTAGTDGNIYVANKFSAGTGTTVSGAHSTIQSAGSFAGAFLETVGSPTFDDTKSVVVYTGSTNVTWTLPASSTCTGRVYILHHSNTAGTITLSASVNKGNGGNFNTITAGQWAWIVSTGSAWRGYKIASL